MSTALVYCGTSQGFVIGADGRAFNRLENRIQSDTDRKIFAFGSAEVAVVFGWAGIVKTRTPNFDFSLAEATYNLLPQLDYTGFFAQELNAKLKDRLRYLGTYELGPCAEGIFLSYRNGAPWVSQISVFKNGRTWDCAVEEGNPNGELDLLSGPSQVFEKPQSLDEATNMIGAYLDDCVAHPTNEIGGHVHIAKFTDAGFSWIRPPKG